MKKDSDLLMFVNGENNNSLGSKVRKYSLYFIMYAVVGWLYEVFLEVVVYQWGFTNRGILYGPYTPIYGVGALLFLILIYPMIKDRKYPEKLIWIVPVFLGCMFTATLLELITSYLLEWTIGAWPWQTYADYALNFQARIALSPSIRFGLGGVLFLYIIQPIFERIVKKLKDNQVKTVFVMIITMLIIDIIYTLFFRYI